MVKPTNGCRSVQTDTAAGKGGKPTGRLPPSLASPEVSVPGGTDGRKGGREVSPRPSSQPAAPVRKHVFRVRPKNMIPFLQVVVRCWVRCSPVDRHYAHMMSALASERLQTDTWRRPIGLFSCGILDYIHLWLFYLFYTILDYHPLRVLADAKQVVV